MLKRQITLNFIKFKLVNASYFISKIFVFFYFYNSILFYRNNISTFFRRIFIVFNIILFDYPIVEIRLTYCVLTITNFIYVINVQINYC